MSSGQFERRQQFAPLESGQRRPLPRDLETGNGRGHGAGSPLTPSAAIITVQDCESSVGLTAAFTMPESFEVLRLQVASRFQYTNVMLYLPSGEQAKTLAVIPTDDLILSTDGKPFPAEFQNLRRQPNGDASAQQHSMRSLPHLSSDRTVDTLESTTQPGPHDVSSGEPMVLEDLWGWRKIGQLVGGKVASEKAMRSWRNSGTAASLIFVIEFMSFSYPPTPVGRRGLDDATWHENPGTQVALRAYFWFSALGMIFGLFALLMATVMSMQLNMMAYESDYIWFFQLYGNTLFGWPTTMLIISIMCLAGTTVSSSFITYPVENHNDAIAFLCLIAIGVLATIIMFVNFSTRSWARINTADARVWPDRDRDRERSAPSSPSPSIENGYRSEQPGFGREPSGNTMSSQPSQINGRSFTSSHQVDNRSMSSRAFDNRQPGQEWGSKRGTEMQTAGRGGDWPN
mmetsp:Transcript_35943/g.85047  ORF Transcript_35943/g.85047 Transcript_35943/m.85047 type:complete len:458 (+) Transcript_35943:302-1675(+)